MGISLENKRGMAIARIIFLWQKICVNNGASQYGRWLMGNLPDVDSGSLCQGNSVLARILFKEDTHG